ncbi:MAG TPA: DUF6781 family protein [Caldimonas sp.]|jgi:hypothetical protein|nr:DUF6781 family protein [Caldimonas sp.]HEX2541960.1 DUF6781 family protein [Caldimonas sp.]
MIKSGIDQDAMITMFAEASAKQGESLRKAVSEATLKALQGREMTLSNIRKVVQSVAGAASLGLAQNPAGAVDGEALLAKTLAGIDSALLQAVEANRKALEQFVGNGVALSEKPLKTALANVEKMEDVFFEGVAKAMEGAGPMQAVWQQALSAFKTKGTDTGAQASATVKDLVGQAQSFMREGRATGMRAAQAMMDSYAAMVSGVLIGMSEGLQAGGAKPRSGRSASSSGTDAAAAAASAAATASEGNAAEPARAAPARKSRPARKRS